MDLTVKTVLPFPSPPSLLLAAWRTCIAWQHVTTPFPDSHPPFTTPDRRFTLFLHWKNAAQALPNAIDQTYVVIYFWVTTATLGARIVTLFELRSAVLFIRGSCIFNRLCIRSCGRIACTIWWPPFSRCLRLKATAFYLVATCEAKRVGDFLTDTELKDIDMEYSKGLFSHEQSLIQWNHWRSFSNK